MKLCWVLVVVGVIGGGCDRGGVLTGSGGAGQLTGSAGAPVGAGGRGGSLVTVGTGGAGAASSGTGGFVSGCGVVVPPARPLAPDILIVLDTSASMNDAFDTPCPPFDGCPDQSKWSAAVSAINAVVSEPSPVVNWGLKFLSTGFDPCEAGGLTVLPGPTNATGFQSELSGRAPAGVLVSQGYTPTRAAIDVAAGYLVARTNPVEHIILLVTDGEPDCGIGASDPFASDGAAAVRAIANAATMGLPTLVAGMAIAPGQADTTLTEMARAGGLAATYTPVSSAADLVAAMNALVDDTSCTFAVPEPPTSYTSRSNIGVRFDDTDIPQDFTNGWTYADATQTAIQLHGTACDTVRTGRIVYVYFRCLLP